MSLFGNDVTNRYSHSLPAIRHVAFKHMSEYATLLLNVTICLPAYLFICLHLHLCSFPIIQLTYSC